MNRRELREVPKADVGQVTQDFIDAGAVQISIVPEENGKVGFHIIALIP